LTLPETLSREQREKAIDLLKRKSDIFSKGEYDLGRTQLLLHHVGLHAPIRQTLRRHPVEHVPIIDKFVDDMLENKIISPLSSDWDYVLQTAPRGKTFITNIDKMKRYNEEVSKEWETAIEKLRSAETDGLQ
jgi:hypothetical protein